MGLGLTIRCPLLKGSEEIGKKTKRGRQRENVDERKGQKKTGKGVLNPGGHDFSRTAKGSGTSLRTPFKSGERRREKNKEGDETSARKYGSRNLRKVNTSRGK